MANKVAKVTFAFWVMKICATTLGETAGDLMSMTMKVGYAVSSIVLLSLFVVSLVGQLSARKFHPFLFWTVVLTTSTAGTTMSDYMDRSLKLGYPLGASILFTCLIAWLVVWRLVDKSLSVSHIERRRSEFFYWIAILFSNTLGTALGDFLADSSGLGFLGGAAVIGSLIALTALAYRFTRLNRIVLFWVAFVLTRPFGATFGDLLTKPIVKGGLNLGTLGSSAVLAVILLVAIVMSSRKLRAQEPEAA
jgi:uncharacterized membrane-anchored protein